MFKKVGVVMGGVSSEREISLKSGNAVLASLKKSFIDAIQIDITSTDPKVIKNLLKESGVDVIFNVLHGKFGEDGQIQAIFEEIGLKYTGSNVSASQITINKILTQKLLKKNNIKVPTYVNLMKGDEHNSEQIVAKVGGFPVVIKPSNEGSSIGVSIVQDLSEFNRGLEDAFVYCDEVLVDKYIHGKEITVGILDKQALPIVEICPKDSYFDFHCKYEKGKTDYIVPARIDQSLCKNIQETALNIHRLCGCSHFSRVDFILSESQEFYCLEINTVPGFTETSLLPMAAEKIGLNFDQLIVEILQLTYGKKKETKDISHSN